MGRRPRGHQGGVFGVMGGGVPRVRGLRGAGRARGRAGRGGRGGFGALLACGGARPVRVEEQVRSEGEQEASPQRGGGGERRVR